VLNGGNGTQAAIKAGYSERTAASTACLLLRQPKIKEYIKSTEEALGKQLKLTPTRWVRVWS
jgi:phage terminase small subunit